MWKHSYLLKRCSVWPPLLWNQFTCICTAWEWDTTPTTAFLEPVLNGNRLNRNQTADQDVIPVCILFNNLPQRQVCGNTNSCYHGIVSCCTWWKKHGIKPHASCCLTATSTAYKATVSVEGKEKHSPPSGQCAAIPSKLFTTAKVHHFHLQRQGSETNLTRINQFAFFIKWLAVLLKELLRTKGSQGNYLQNWCQGWRNR